MEEMRSFLLILVYISLITNAGLAQESDNLERCNTEIPEGYKQIDTYEFHINELNEGKDHKVNLTSGNKYVMILCHDHLSRGEVAVDLYDKHDQIVATNFDIRTSKEYHSMYFTCHKTGKYYLKYHLEDCIDCDGDGVGVFAENSLLTNN